jgi:hypothetical protein
MNKGNRLFLLNIFGLIQLGLWGMNLSVGGFLGCAGV